MTPQALFGISVLFSFVAWAIVVSSTDWMLLRVLNSGPFLFAYLVHAQDKVGATTSPDFRYKLAIAVRRDLEMGKGKIAVQVSHASVTVAE